MLRIVTWLNAEGPIFPATIRSIDLIKSTCITSRYLPPGRMQTEEMKLHVTHDLLPRLFIPGELLPLPRSFIYNHSSTNPASLAKIGPIDIEIIRPTEIVKTNKKQMQNTGRLPLHFGWINGCTDRQTRPIAVPIAILSPLRRSVNICIWIFVRTPGHHRSIAQWRDLGLQVWDSWYYCALFIAKPKAARALCSVRRDDEEPVGIRANMTSSIKPEIHNISLRSQGRTEPRPQWRSDV